MKKTGLLKGISVCMPASHEVKTVQNHTLQLFTLPSSGIHNSRKTLIQGFQILHKSTQTLHNIVITLDHFLMLLICLSILFSFTPRNILITNLSLKYNGIGLESPRTSIHNFIL